MTIYLEKTNLQVLFFRVIFDNKKYNFKKKIMVKKYLLLAAFIIIFLLLLFRGCKMENERADLLKQISAYQLGEKAFKTKILKDSSTLASQTQTIMSQDEAIRLGLLKLEGDIKNVKSQVRTIQTINIDSVFVPYENGGIDTALWLKKIKEGQVTKELIDSLINNSVIVPKDFEKETKWYGIYGKVKKDGIMVDSLDITNESSVTVGWKKTGFLNLKREPSVEVKNTNPYLQVTKMRNVVVKDKKGIFESKYFWIGIGAVGFGLLKKL